MSKCVVSFGIQYIEEISVQSITHI